MIIIDVCRRICLYLSFNLCYVTSSFCEIQWTCGYDHCDQYTLKLVLRPRRHHGTPYILNTRFGTTRCYGIYEKSIKLELPSTPNRIRFRIVTMIPLSEEMFTDPRRLGLKWVPIIIVSFTPQQWS